MGNSWPGAREVPDRQVAHGEGDIEAALAMLKASRGSQWTEEVEALVEYRLRSNWAGPRPKETQHQWAARLCAIYEDQEPAMHKWLDRSLRTETQGEEWRNQAQDGPGEPPRSADGKEPEPDPGQPQGSHEGQWSQDHEGSRPWGSGWNGSAENPNRTDYPRPDAWGSRSAWSSGRTLADPWHARGSQDPQGTQGEEAGAAPSDPWGAYTNRQQPQEPREQQQTEENRQPEQVPAGRHAPAEAGQQPPRTAPWWEEEWSAGRTHTDLRYGDWRCGRLPCRFANHAYRSQCKICQAPKSLAKWELPTDPQTRTCMCGNKILPSFRGACKVCRNPIEPLEGGGHPYNPQGDAPLPDPPIASDLQGHSVEPILLWTEAIVNPMGPPWMSGSWPAITEIHYAVAQGPCGAQLRVPYVTSDTVAEVWRADHAKLCGKLLGHRRRAWTDTKPPRSSTSGGPIGTNTARSASPSSPFGRTTASRSTAS